MNQYRQMLEQVRDLKLKKDDLPVLSYDEETDLLENPLSLTRQHVINILKRFKQERLGLSDLFDWIHFIWFSDLFSCKKEDADSIASVVQFLEDLEEEGDIISSEIDYCLNALENNRQVESWFGDDL
jgi:hypothetical protein